MSKFDSISVHDETSAADVARPIWWHDASRSSWMIVAIAVIVVILGLNWRVVTGTVAVRWDAEDFFAPYFDLIGAHARAGRLMLWDPWVSGGSPDFAEPQIGALSPLEVSVSAITGGSEGGFRAYWLVLWMLGSLGILVIGHHLHSPPWGTFAVAIGWAFSGLYLGEAEHTSILYAVAFLPWMVWRFDVSLKSARILPALEAGALWGLSALGGYPALTILNGSFLFLWGLGRWIDSESPRFPKLRFTILSLAIIFVIGICILSPAYYGFYSEAQKFSDRTGGFPREAVLKHDKLSPGNLASFASPYLPILKIYNPGLWKFTDVTMGSIYQGVVTPLLAAFALIVRPRSRFRLYLGLVAVVLIVCALGSSSPVRGWLYDLFVPSRYFTHSALFRIYAMFLASILAICASRDIDAFLHSPESKEWGWLTRTAVALSVLALLAYGLTMHWIPNHADRSRYSALHVLIAWLGITALIFSRRFLVGAKLFCAVLIVIALFDAASSYYLSQQTVYDTSSMRGMWNRLEKERRTNLDLTSRALCRDPRAPQWTGTYLENRNIPLRIPTLENFVGLQNRFLEKSAAIPVLEEMATGCDRAWFSSSTARVVIDDNVFEAFKRRSVELAVPIMVEHSRLAMSQILKPGEGTAADMLQSAQIAKLPPAERIPVEVVSYWPNRLTLKVSTPVAGWLMITDRWAPGWQATINGNRAEVLGADFLFRAIQIPAGSDLVRFEYHPAGFPLLLSLSWGTLLVVGSFSIFNSISTPQKLRLRRNESI